VVAILINMPYNPERSLGQWSHFNYIDGRKQIYEYQ
jgi:hypothetical protein